MIDYLSLLFLPAVISVIIIFRFLKNKKINTVAIGFVISLLSLRILFFGTSQSWHFHNHFINTDQDNIHEFMLTQNLVTNTNAKKLLIGDSVLHSLAGSRVTSDENLSIIYNFQYSPYELLTFLEMIDRKKITEIGLFINPRAWAALDRNSTHLFPFNYYSCYQMSEILIKESLYEKRFIHNLLHRCLSYIFPEVHYFTIVNAYINSSLNNILLQPVKRNYVKYLSKGREEIRIAYPEDIEQSLNDKKLITYNLSAIEVFIKNLNERGIRFTIVESPMRPDCVSNDVNNRVNEIREKINSFKEQYSHFDFKLAPYLEQVNMIDCMHFNELENNKKEKNNEYESVLKLMFGVDNAIH